MSPRLLYLLTIVDPLSGATKSGLSQDAEDWARAAERGYGMWAVADVAIRRGR